MAAPALETVVVIRPGDGADPELLFEKACRQSLAMVNPGYPRWLIQSRKVTLLQEINLLHVSSLDGFEKAGYSRSLSRAAMTRGCGVHG